jgi:DNA-binding CsgD family transcriptional regulator
MSATEEQVLECLKKGMTSEKIAKKFRVSRRTIESRRSSLTKRYRSKSSFQLGFKVGRSE